jgi:hypothetical protein
VKKLVIAEKPSVARDLARVLGNIPKKEDYFENDEWVIDCAVGHLVELFMPDDFDKKLKSWKLANLPIIPPEFQLKPIAATKKKYQQLKKQLKRKDVDTVINACDAGREGELIFTYIYELAKSAKPVQRLWMLSMTDQSVKDAFANLRDGEQLQPLQDAARCRSESDWLIGINGTRAVTIKRSRGRSRQVSTVGRVQTPTLSLVIQREKEIREFVPRTYFKITADFGLSAGNYVGFLQKPDFKKSEDDKHDRVDRLWDKDRRASPGGIANAFWEPVRITSIPHSSFGMGTTEKELTVSITEITSGKSCKTAIISCSGFISPQEVSLCTRVTRSYSPLERCFRRSSGSMCLPQSTCRPSAGFPDRRETSSHLSEKAPHIQQSTFFWDRLRTAPSITPHALEVDRNTGSSVWKSFCRLGWHD